MTRNKSLRRLSDNKRRETAKYWPLRRRFLEDHPFCEFPLGGHQACMNYANSIHHMRGQHWKIMNDTRWWMGLCIEHHGWVEDHKNEARAKGLILYK